MMNLEKFIAFYYQHFKNFPSYTPSFFHTELDSTQAFNPSNSFLFLLSNQNIIEIVIDWFTVYWVFSDKSSH